MSKHACPHCGFTYDDQTGEITDKPQAAPVFAELDKLRGYRPPKRAAEAAAILRMLKKYTPEQVMDTWKKGTCNLTLADLVTLGYNPANRLAGGSKCQISLNQVLEVSYSGFSEIFLLGYTL